MFILVNSLDYSNTQIRVKTKIENSDTQGHKINTFTFNVGTWILDQITLREIKKLSKNYRKYNIVDKKNMHITYVHCH